MPFADLGPVRLHYELSGEGPLVILIAGWALNTHFWEGVLPYLEPTHSVLRYDVRGTGRSASPTDIEYSRAADAEDLLALMDRLKVRKAHLVGHSKGARISLIFAMLHPERVLSVTAIGSAEPHGTLPGERAFRPIAHAWVVKAKEVAMNDGPQAAAKYLAQGKLFGKLRTSVEGMRRLHRAMEGYSASDLLSTVPRREIDTDSLATKLSMPVHFVVGTEDPFLSECDYAHRRVPTSVLTKLPGAGHMVPFEEPDLIGPLLLRHIASDSSCAPPSVGL
jgi:pimeloyl-ACP methyl ester carboxylesterase